MSTPKTSSVAPNAASTPRKSTRSNAPNKRELLIDAAIVEFAKRGYAGTDVQSITRRCSLAKGTLYLYFKSKEDLFWETLLHIGRIFERVVRQIAASPLEPVEKIRDLMVSVAEVIQANPDFIPVITQCRSVPNEKIPPEVSRSLDGAFFEPLCGVIQEGIERNIFVRFRVEDHTTSLLNAMWGVVMFYRPQEDSLSLPDRIRFTVDMAMNGMLKR